MVWIITLCVLLVALSGSYASEKVKNTVRSFQVDYEHDQFLKDGEPFQYVSGSLHYFRVPLQYWRDRLRKLRAAGLNVVSTYIEWSRHEPRRGVFDFTGDNDFERFVKTAEEEGLLVILRPGPYICAERDLGGYPPWLLHENPQMIFRTLESSHIKHVNNWLEVLLPKMQPLLYGNGGPVIMVQVENEYGSYVVCDKGYTSWLRDVFLRYVSTKALLFTTDGYSSNYLQCGPIRGVFITVDFGSETDVSNAFAPLRKIQPHGPLVNSEFYPGWLTHWGESKSVVGKENIVNATRTLLATNASFNYYVFFGGTNFGFTSGVNTVDAGNLFLPQITSYDYDAPITESGDLTEKYYQIQSVISEFMPIPNITVKNSAKMSYGSIKLDAKLSLLHSRSDQVAKVYENLKYPVTFEALQQYSGFLLYETSLPDTFAKRGLLIANNVHDRAMVYVGRELVGVLSRHKNMYSLFISGEGGQSLSLLVENQGHINFKNMTYDLKGITENVTLDGDILTNWKHTGFPLDNVMHIPALPVVEDVKLPAFYSGRFQLPENLSTPLDTFIDMSGWTKGQLYVNNHNLGRYWSSKGPQVTLYLPGPYLLPYPDYNTVVVLELEKTNPSGTVNSVMEHIWIN